MTAAFILGAAAVLLLLPLAVAGIRQPALVTMAVRNIRRRRAEAMLVVGGALLGTAIITSSLVVGDVVGASLRNAASTQYGPIDITITPSADVDLGDVVAAVEAAEIEEVDGLLATKVATLTLEAPERGTAVPQVTVTELDLDAARRFGSDPQITGIVGSEVLRAGEILLNESIAGRLEAEAGDGLRLHAYGSEVDLTVTEVVPEMGLAGYAGAIVAPDSPAMRTHSAPAETALPRAQLLVSLDGGVFDTRGLSDDAVTDLRAALADLPGVEVEAPKAGVLDDAERDGASLTELFATIGAFSVLAGILLLVNLFVMLAEERKTELGMLRALGFTRRRLTRAFALEGAIYALLASASGTVVGIGIGWLVAVVAGGIVGVSDQGSGYPLVVEPVSLAIGGTTGLSLSLVTIWVTTSRIARLNIIRAIRDLPESKVLRVRTRALVLGTVGVMAGVAAGVVGYLDDNAIGLLLGVPVAAFSATPLLRRFLSDRSARLLVAGVVLAWGLAVYPFFPEVMGASDTIVFVLQGIVLTAGAVALAASLDRVWAFAIERLGTGRRGLAPRLGVAYPLARRFRTAMLLGMFSLVIFTVTILTTFSAMMDRHTDATVDQMAAGYDIVLDTSPANPVDVETLTARDHVAAVTGLLPGVAQFQAEHLATGRAWPVTGIDADLLRRGTPSLFRKDEAYASDADVYRAVINDPTLAIVPENFLVGGMSVAALDVGDTFTVVLPGAEPRELTIAGLSETDWLGNGALVSRELTTELFGAQGPVARFYLAVTDGADADVVASALNSAFLAHGADARTFADIGAEGVRELTRFLALLQGFLGLGLLVGIAGLGVVMVRAVRERRQEIGMLRAMGFGRGLIRTAMLAEAGLIALQGTLIGAALGLVTTRQLLLGGAFGDVPIAFVVPWGGLAVILALPLAAVLLATAWPASRAAAIPPAIALRTAE